MLFSKKARVIGLLFLEVQASLHQIASGEAPSEGRPNRLTDIHFELLDELEDLWQRQELAD